MDLLQTRDARKLLGMIRDRLRGSNDELTYSKVAELLGHSPMYARHIAHVGNLLDAAATFAGVPVLALVKVLTSDRQINPEAFLREFGERRSKIIARSLSYRFGDDDIGRIGQALDNLGNRGDQKAWRYIESLYPGDLLYLRLIGEYTANNSDAIDDLGSDTPDRASSTSTYYARDPAIRNAVMVRAGGKCEYCGVLGFVKPDGYRYLECHHVIALAADGADRMSNVIALCPNHHREAHFSSRAQELEEQMIIIVQALQLTSATKGQ